MSFQIFEQKYLFSKILTLCAYVWNYIKDKTMGMELRESGCKVLDYKH